MSTTLLTIFYSNLFYYSDFFRGPVVPSVRLAGLEHVLHFTALEGKIYMRSYRHVCLLAARPSTNITYYS